MSKKFNLKKPLKLMEEFAAGELDSSATTATDNTATVQVDQTSQVNQSGAEIRAEIVKDVDAILTNLETLSKQIQEGFEQIKQDVLDGNEEVLEMFSSLNESTLITEKDVTLGELMAYSEDDYKYLKDQAKKLGVTVTVYREGDAESMYDDMGYDTLSFRGPKDAVLKVASISGHDADICPESDPDCGGYVLEESVEVNEDSKTVSKTVMDYLFKMKAARKDMDKVNKVKQNAVAIDLAAKGLDGSDKQEKAKKDKLVAKAKSAKEKGDELEKAVRDKYADRTELVQKVIRQKDIEGKLAAIKQETGMEDNPKKKSELKDKMKELNTQLKKEDDAIKQIEKDAEPEAEDAKDAIEAYKEEVKKLKAKGYKAQALKDGQEGDEVTLNHPETGKQIFSKPKDAKGSFDEEKAQAAIDKAKEAKKAYTDVDGNNNPVKIAELELVVLAAELEMAKGKGEDTKEIEDKIKAAKLTTKRTPKTSQTDPAAFNEEEAQAAIDSAQEAWNAVKDKEDQKPQDQAAVELELVKAKIAMAKGKGEDDKVAELEDKFMELEAIKNIEPVQVPNSGTQNDSVQIDLDPNRTIVEASLNQMQAVTDDDYEYLKGEAKKLGVKVTVDVDPYGDGTDEISFSGDKEAIMKLAQISGHAVDIPAVYQIEEGNAFGAARAEAIAKGEKTFKVGDEEYDVEAVDAEDKENAEEYAEEEGIATEAVVESASFKMGSVASRFRSLM